MPIYHFHDANGSREFDKEGTELPDEQAARILAARFAGEMLEHDPTKLWSHGQWRVEVTDHRNVLLFTLIALAVEAPRPGEFGAG